MNELDTGYQVLQRSDMLLLAGLLLGNGLFSALVAWAAGRRLPYRNRQQRALLSLLILFAGLFIPLLGSAGVALAMLGGMRWQAAADKKAFLALARTEFNPLGMTEAGSSQRGALHARIGQKTLPTEQRLQSIAALQHLPLAAASPVLHTLLDDTVEDVRLMAFGMLEKEEKKIAERIHELSQQPPPKTGAGASARDKQLAELHWELVYSGLVQGDLRHYTLTHALSHAEAALESKDDDAGLHFLAGRILDALGRPEEAQHHLQVATALGMPEQRTLPYLAEFAFERGEYHEARQMLDVMHETQVTPRLRPVMDYWLTRES